MSNDYDDPNAKMVSSCCGVGSKHDEYVGNEVCEGCGDIPAYVIPAGAYKQVYAKATTDTMQNFFQDDVPKDKREPWHGRPVDDEVDRVDSE